jgi:hypothetical protein
MAESPKRTRLFKSHSPVFDGDRPTEGRYGREGYTPSLDGAAGAAGTARLVITVRRHSALGAGAVVHVDLGLCGVVLLGGSYESWF